MNAIKKDMVDVLVLFQTLESSKPIPVGWCKTSEHIFKYVNEFYA